MNQENKLLSDLIVYMKYAKYLPHKQSRESWRNIVNRNMFMHIDKFTNMEEEIISVYKNYVVPKKVLPSMRSLQFAGKAIEVNPTRIFNCSFLPADDVHAFSETMFLLLSGTGVGFSCQKQDVEKLPNIKTRQPNTTRYLIGDSIEGWADAVKMLMKSYFYGYNKVDFDFSAIRPKGELLVTSGGKAPGAAPLRICLTRIDELLANVPAGRQLKPIEVHDIMCFIADAVLAGGIRRAALISLFSHDDDEMLTCKAGSWWEANPQRGRANNSAMLLRSTTTEMIFNSLWERIEASYSGEPAIIFTNSLSDGYNPCVEAALRPFTFCNLVEINGASLESQEDFNNCAKAAAFIGTLQASYTDFHYLRPIWRQNTNEDALLGVSITGIGSGVVDQFDAKEAAQCVVTENKRVANLIGINEAKRCTNIKPAGTSSIVLGTSSGIHNYFAPYYIRRVRVAKNEAIYGFLQEVLPCVLEDDLSNPDGACIVIPQKAPDTASMDDGAINILERVKKYYESWVLGGHVEGTNTHNISATIYMRENEFGDIREWLWSNKDYYNGISTLRKDDNTYKQAPFEAISQEEYERRCGELIELDFTKVVEITDETNLQGEAACSGGMCELV